MRKPFAGVCKSLCVCNTSVYTCRLYVYSISNRNIIILLRYKPVVGNGRVIYLFFPFCFFVYFNTTSSFFFSIVSARAIHRLRSPLKIASYSRFNKLVNFFFFLTLPHISRNVLFVPYKFMIKIDLLIENPL